MKFYSETLAKVLNFWPGKSLGIYRFLPIFFVFGAGLEFTMIKWDVGGRVNFYRTYKKRRVQELADEAMKNLE
ncbi:small integral membrane protein 4 [Macrosteles quadrilineatus]|uniref:small integral membrane protein 4 n=1 Tax=Macrosteles quadrilineatus TaxID=74068 RepID=UPI0023E1EE10|nr:small integral membrane protein 4 [Macrosteles quadrilineatus]